MFRCSNSVICLTRNVGNSHKKKTNEEMMVALLFIFICVELEFWIYFYCGREVLKWMCVDMMESEG